MKSKNMMFAIFKKEIRDVIRDKKTLFMMVIIPLLLYPLMFGFILKLQDSMMTADESNYNKIGFAFETDEILNTLIDELKIDKTIGTEHELKDKFENDELDGYLTLNGNEFTIYYTEQDNYGYATLQLANELIESYKKILQYNLLTNEGLIPDDFFNVYTVKKEDVSKTDAMTEYMIGMVPTFILMTTALTANFVAIDMTAGEKERGTLETLLTFPLKNRDIIGGKFLATACCTVISAIIRFLSIYGVLYYLSGVLESYKGMQLLSFGNICLILILFIAFSMLMSALAIVIASRAKSYKEAQNSTQPLLLLTMIPMFMSMMGTKLDSTLSLIPIINVNLLLSDIISNTVNIKYVILTLLSNLIFVFVIMKAIIKLYKSDKILFS